MRKTLGTAVFAGMLGVTVFGIFLTPVFYVVIRWFAKKQNVGHEPPATVVTSHAPEREPVAVH
jgi:multidrug efflux pump